jgi:hypothetical protein
MLLQAMAVMCGGFVSLAVVVWVLPRRIKRDYIFKPLLLATMRDNPPSPDSYKSFKDSVLPHGPLQKIHDDLYVVSGTLPQPGPSFNRNMVVYRLSDGHLVIHSPVCVNTETLAEIKALGPVSYIIVPNRFHRLDAANYHLEFPNAKVVCPAKDHKSINTWVPVDETCEAAFASVDDVTVLIPEGTCNFMSELVYLVAVGAEWSSHAIIMCDFMFNINPTTADRVTKFLGAASGFGLTWLGTRIAEDLEVLKSWITTQLLAKTDDSNSGRDIVALVVAHGDPVCGRESVAQKLREAIDRIP